MRHSTFQRPSMLSLTSKIYFRRFRNRGSDRREGLNQKPDVKPTASRSATTRRSANNSFLAERKFIFARNHFVSLRNLGYALEVSRVFTRVFNTSADQIGNHFGRGLREVIGQNHPNHESLSHLGHSSVENLS